MDTDSREDAKGLIQLRDTEGKSLGVAAAFPEGILTKGLPFRHAGRHYEVADWHYEIESAKDPASLIVTLTEIRKPWFARNEDRQVFFGYLMISPTLVFLVAGLLLYHYDPTVFWAVTGYWIRGTVSWLLVGTGLVLTMQVKNGIGSDRPTLLGIALWCLFMPLGMILAIVWAEASRSPTPLQVWPEDYVWYVEFLRTKFSSFWPLVLAAIPWIAFLLNVGGFEFAAKAIDLIKGSAKGGKE